MAALTIHGRFQITGWDEEIVEELETGVKIARVRATRTFTGDLAGEGIIYYLMTYSADGAASFSGSELISGTLSGKGGQFLLQHSGSYEGGIARAETSIVENTGTDAFFGLAGQGSYAAEGREADFTLEIQLP